MKTYISIFDKKATLANNKKEATDKLGISANKVITSDIHLSMLKGYDIV